MSDSTTHRGPSAGNERFNEDAAEWDSNPFVHAMSLEAWAAIQASVPSLSPEERGDARQLDVLEVGCGTGLLSMEVAPAVKRLVAIDTAEGMIDVLSAKLRKPGAPDNIIPLALLLEDPEDKRLPRVDDANPESRALKFDLAVSHLVLHHIADVRKVLTTILGCLKEGGMAALTDFEDFGPEARRFHPEAKMDGVERHGIGREWMAALMRDVGFKDVSVEVAWEHSKMTETYPGEFKDGKPTEGQGQLMKFSYLICLGTKG